MDITQKYNLSNLKLSQHSRERYAERIMGKEKENDINRFITLNEEKIIYLSPIGTRDSAENAMNIGATDVFFNDMAECNYTATSSTKYDVQLNNMVYLGLNNSNGALNNYIRNAIAAKIDSEKIVDGIAEYEPE